MQNDHYNTGIRGNGMNQPSRQQPGVHNAGVIIEEEGGTSQRSSSGENDHAQNNHR